MTHTIIVELDILGYRLVIGSEDRPLVFHVIYVTLIQHTIIVELDILWYRLVIRSEDQPLVFHVINVTLNIPS